MVGVVLVMAFNFVGGLPLNKALEPRLFKLWFGADPAIDREIRDKFEADYLLLTQQPQMTTENATDCLAKVIILDQFSRNMYRDTPRMFAADPQALSLAKDAINKSLHLQIQHPLMRFFLYLVTLSKVLFIFSHLCIRSVSKIRRRG